MKPDTIKAKLVEILNQIQTDSGLECPSLTGLTRPIEDIPKFDSKVWPVATTILSAELGAPIPDEVNIFVDSTTKLARSIDETVTFVFDLLKKQAAVKVAA